MKIESKRPNSRKVQAEERRLQILETALSVFASNGFKGTSIKDIAEAAGISQGLMYHYFSSKEDLLETTVAHYSFLPQLQRILTHANECPLNEVLAEIANQFLAMLDSRARLIRIFIQEVDSNLVVRKAWANLCRDGVALLHEYIESQIASGALRPHNPEVTARCLFGIIFMFHFTRDIFQSSPVTKEEFISNALNTILHGIRNQ
jgi:AcrR family transcriptional regulator